MPKVSDNDLASITDFKDFLYQKIVPLEDLFDYKGEPLEKILPFWRKMKLIPFIPKGKKAQISFANLIWLHLLDLLRQFNVPIENMEKVTEYFFKDAYDASLPEKRLKANLEYYRKKEVAGTLDFDEIQNLRYIEEFLQDEAKLQVLKLDINYLTEMIVNCLDSRMDRGILIFLDGRVGEFDGDEYNSHRDGVIIDPTEPHIYISVIHLLRFFVKDAQLSEVVVPQLLNEDERIVLRELRSKNLQTLTITLKDEDPHKVGGRIVRFDATHGGRLSEAEAQQIKDILGLQNYEGIELTTQNHKDIKFKRTRKRFIKDSD
ncbi:hypothetical protein [Flaviaesturariibacter aridisoli]|uniref:Uncharacterized protein n=1 Tax=Flaviaesturariibacter aridisoli TaxID=2545761 RepID=A0A4R4DT14_9BACT|nr:hypothetical protein [Flaviaesturariibacter aridisoli]TCZ64584.1 hypothetical protein E0486_18175 [Flaviaesturariibacter aridisoli]